MKDQTMDFAAGATSPQVSGPVAEMTADYPGAGFWLRVYPPLNEWTLLLPHSRMICPWTMAAELEDSDTPAARRQNIMEALKKGLKTIRQYDLPACRILFAEDNSTHLITVWVN